MENLKFYEIDNRYIDYLAGYAPHLFRNKKQGQQNERKYIGVIITVNDFDYFAPLSSFKEKHKRMKDALDFLKVKDYAVINLNNMFPVKMEYCRYVDIKAEHNPQYKALLLAEYRSIKSMQDKIRKNAFSLYNHRIKNGDKTPLGARCNDFTLLEKACSEYRK